MHIRLAPGTTLTIVEGKDVLFSVKSGDSYGLNETAARMLRIDATARSSMWDDVQQGRTTEVDDLCGAVVRLATQHGTQAPCNAAMCQLIAAHTQGQRWTGSELRQTLHI